MDYKTGSRKPCTHQRTLPLNISLPGSTLTAIYLAACYFINPSGGSPQLTKNSQRLKDGWGIKRAPDNIGRNCIRYY